MGVTDSRFKLDYVTKALEDVICCTRDDMTGQVWGM